MFMPRINRKKCKEARECIDVCPVDVFELDGDETVVANPADCIGCESCIAVCPEEAITVEEI
jgi:NAD-dependent dihydropyrimidine dehydrogenase PreA subunit